MSREYAVDIYHHLRRARHQLDSGTNEGVFYAAFELRCGVESRIQSYLDASEDISKKKKKGWKVAAAGRELDKAFTEGLKIIEFTVILQSSNRRVPFIHTPVKPELRTAVGKLGDLLHAQKETIPGDSPWWGDTRLFLESVFRMVEELSLGTLRAPVAFSPTGEFTVHSYYGVSNPISAEFHDADGLAEGAGLTVEVDYHDDMPDHAVPFLNDWKPNNIA